MQQVEARINSSRQEDSLVATLRQEIAREEMELKHSALRRSISQAAQVLSANPQWVELQKTLRTQEKTTLQALSDLADPTPVAVGRMQAYIRALRLMTIDPMTQEELAELDGKDRIRAKKIAELRDLLPQPRTT